MRSWAWYRPLLRDAPDHHLISCRPHTGGSSSTAWANGTPALLHTSTLNGVILWSPWQHGHCHWLQQHNTTTVTCNHQHTERERETGREAETDRERNRQKDTHTIWKDMENGERNVSVGMLSVWWTQTGVKGQDSWGDTTLWKCFNPQSLQVFSHKFCSSSYTEVHLNRYSF